MKRISDYSKSWENDCASVRRLLDEWHPRSFALSKKEQEQDLQIWLQQNLPEVPLVAQFEIANGCADLLVEDSHLIQLALGFTKEKLAEFDTCLGQLERYRQKWVNTDRGVVYLVVVGKSETEFRDMIHSTFEQLNHGSVVKCFFLAEKYVE
jgi:hypothetical protein